MRLFLEAVRADLTLISKIKWIYLHEVYDVDNSGLLGFIDSYDLDPHDKPELEVEVKETTVADAQSVAAIDPFENIVGSFVLLNSLNDDPATKSMYSKLLKDLLEILMESDEVYDVRSADVN